MNILTKLQSHDRALKYLMCKVRDCNGGGGGGGIDNEEDPIFKASPAYTITEQNKLDWNAKLDEEVDTLSTVVSRGNNLNKVINVGDNINGTTLLKLFWDNSKANLYWGDYNDSVANTNTYDTSIGYKTLTKTNGMGVNIAIGHYIMTDAITAHHNTVVGTVALAKLTAGNFNSVVGSFSLQALTTGSRNTSIGYGVSQIATTASHGIYIGIGAAPNLTTGNSNIAIGDNSLANQVDKVNTIGIGKDTGAGGQANHCIYLGSRAGTSNTTDGVLAIHNWSLNQPNDNINGTYSQTVAQMNYANSLIYGNFLNRTMTINGSFKVPSWYLPIADSDVTYTKNIVATENGDFGWETRIKRPSGFNATSLNTIVSETTGDVVLIDTSVVGTSPVVNLSINNTNNCKAFHLVFNQIGGTVTILAQSHNVVAFVKDGNIRYEIAKSEIKDIPQTNYLVFFAGNTIYMREL